MQIKELIATLLNAPDTAENDAKVLDQVISIFKAHIPRESVESRQNVFRHSGQAPNMSCSLIISQGARAYWWINLFASSAPSTKPIECRVSAWVREDGDDTHLLGSDQDIHVTYSSDDTLDDIAKRAVETIQRFHQETLVELGVDVATAKQVAIQQWNAP